MALEPPPAIPYHTGIVPHMATTARWGSRRGVMLARSRSVLAYAPARRCPVLEYAAARLIGYRDKARVLHPDVGGNPDDWDKVRTSPL
eukprot:3130400-Rhodomonas_salina.1